MSNSDKTVGNSGSGNGSDKGSEMVKLDLDDLLAQVDLFTSTVTAAEDIEEEAAPQGEKKFLAYPHKKEVPFIQCGKTATTYQWRQYIKEEKDYNKMPLVVPHRKVTVDGEESFMPLNVVVVGGIIIHTRGRAVLSYYKNEKTHYVCGTVGHGVYKPAQNPPTVYLKDLPETIWPSMHGYDKAANKAATEVPHEQVPANLFGQQGNCRNCIAAGCSTVKFTKDDGSEATASCQARGVVYIYVTHMGVMNLDPNAKIKPANLVTRNYRQTGTFTGEVTKEVQQSLELLPVRNLYDSNEKQLEPFIMAVDLSPASVRGKASQGSVPITNYVKVIKNSRSQLPAMRELYSIIHLNIPVKDSVVHHFEGFTSEGDSIYKDHTTYNVYMDLSPTHKAMIQETMREQYTHPKAGQMPLITAEAMGAWLRARNDDPVEEFDPIELFGPQYLKPFTETEGDEDSGSFYSPQDTLNVRATAVPSTGNMKSANPVNDFDLDSATPDSDF